jgi:hypothetical protein
LTRTLGIPWWKRCGVRTLADRRGIRLLSVNSAPASSTTQRCAAVPPSQTTARWQPLPDHGAVASHSPDPAGGPPPHPFSWLDLELGGGAVEGPRVACSGGAADSADHGLVAPPPPHACLLLWSSSPRARLVVVMVVPGGAGGAWRQQWWWCWSLVVLGRCGGETIIRLPRSCT